MIMGKKENCIMIRLDDNLYSKVKKRAKELNVAKSVIVTMAVAEKLGNVSHSGRNIESILNEGNS